VDDIVQSVFGSFFRGASQGFYDLPEGEELWRLFLVIALNKIRARARYHHAACRDARKTAGAEIYTFTLENVAARSDDAERLLALVVEDALEQLPEAQRAVIRLRIEGHDVTEISRRIGRSQRSTERLLQEARQKLAVLLSESEPSPPS
jgi:RNA polymerase sigma-70 factor (ECF subfamily)